jgi:hypothetical protein
MQVFVKRNNLSLATQAPVIAVYPDDPVVDRAAHGTDVAVLSLPFNAYYNDSTTHFIYLVDNWRSNAAQIVNNEAQRRIFESFSDFMQRDALARMQTNIIAYGTATGSWPAGEQANYSTAQNGWNYVSSIRQRSDVHVTNMPIDPTDDSNWPTRIAVIYIA